MIFETFTQFFNGLFYYCWTPLCRTWSQCRFKGGEAFGGSRMTFGNFLSATWTWLQTHQKAGWSLRTCGQSRCFGKVWNSWWSSPATGWVLLWCVLVCLRKRSFGPNHHFHVVVALPMADSPPSSRRTKVPWPNTSGQLSSSQDMRLCWWTPGEEPGELTVRGLRGAWGLQWEDIALGPGLVAELPMWLAPEHPSFLLFHRNILNVSQTTQRIRKPITMSPLPTLDCCSHFVILIFQSYQEIKHYRYIRSSPQITHSHSLFSPSSSDKNTIEFCIYPYSSLLIFL